VRSRFRLVMAAAVVLGVVLGPGGPAAATHDFHPHPSQWWFPPWSIQEKVWPFTQGQGVTVAILDSGVNASLPELAHVVLPGSDMVGHSRNGYTDYEWDGHGTSMAVLIAGQGGGATGFVGIAPRAKILPITVDGTKKINSWNVDTTLVKGINYAVDHGAKVINMSLAGASRTRDYCPADVMAAVAYAVDHDVVLVAAAGNDGNSRNDIEYPAVCPGVLAVGAIDDHSRPWNKTEVQDYVSVAAPGVDIPVTGKDPDFSFPHSSGTSDSAALVSGAAALVRSANPTMPAREVVHRLIGTALDVHTPGWDNRTGYGVVRINRALNTGYVMAEKFPNPPYERFDQWRNPADAPPVAMSSAPLSEGQPARPEGAKRGVDPAIVGFAVVAGTGVLAGAVWLVLVAARRRRHAGVDAPCPSTPPAAVSTDDDGRQSSIPVESGSSGEGG
jgi:membrane-anchored mycosin MYCP